MKRILCLLFVVVLMTGCASQSDLNEQLLEEQNSEMVRLEEVIKELKTEKDNLENEIKDIKIEKDIAKYIITINIKQSHFTLDIGKHIKDKMNDIDIQIPVDKDFYDSVEVGTVLDDSFRVGSFWMEGSIGSWDIKVIDKEIQ